MSLSFLAPKPALDPVRTDADGRLLLFGGDLTVQILPYASDTPFRTRMVFKAGSKHTCGKNATGTPPYHWHWYQTETFNVHSGTLAYKLNDEEGTIAAGQSLVIPPGAPHTFWNPDGATEDMDVTISTTGGDRPGFDEHFDGYVSDCGIKGVAPNPIQLFVFLNSADVVLADLPLGLGRAVNFVLGGVVGQQLLGMSTGFKEFETSAQ